MTKDILNFDVKIKGIVPLLMARFPEEEWEFGQPAPKPVPLTKEEAFEISKYKLEKDALDKEGNVTSKAGTLYCPSAHIIGAMVKAGARVVVKGRLTYSEIAKGATFIFPEQIPHLIQKVEIDWRPGNNGVGAKKVKIMIARARLEKWELAFRLSCFDDRAVEGKLKQVLEIAGGYIGIGSYRPRYGRFEIVEWNKAKPEAKI